MVFPQMNWQEPRELLNQSPLNEKKKTSVMLQLYLKEEKSHIHEQNKICLFDSSLTMHCAIISLTSIALLNCSHIKNCSMGTCSWINKLWFNFILGLHLFPFVLGHGNV